MDMRLDKSDWLTAKHLRFTQHTSEPPAKAGKGGCSGDDGGGGGGGGGDGGGGDGGNGDGAGGDCGGDGGGSGAGADGGGGPPPSDWSIPGRGCVSSIRLPHVSCSGSSPFFLSLPLPSSFPSFPFPHSPFGSLSPLCWVEPALAGTGGQGGDPWLSSAPAAPPPTPALRAREEPHLPLTSMAPGDTSLGAPGPCLAFRLPGLLPRLSLPQPAPVTSVFAAGGKPLAFSAQNVVLCPSEKPPLRAEGSFKRSWQDFLGSDIRTR